MLDVHALIASSEISDTSAGENTSLRQRLSLYQVFLRLYEQNRTLLDEILDLEGAGHATFNRSTVTPYVQGVMVDGRVTLITNLVKGETQAIAQPQHIWTIGRDRRKAIIPIADNRLSRCHAAIAYHSKEESFYLVDFESTNGSFVNGEQIRKRYRLRDGDRVRLGSLSFSFFTCRSMCISREVTPELMQQVGVCLGFSEKMPDSEAQTERFQTLRAEATPPQDTNDGVTEIQIAASVADGTEDAEACIDSSKAILPPDDTLMFLRRL